MRKRVVRRPVRASHSGDHPRGRRASERGAALVEAAFVAPVFFLMLFAVFEFGFLFRNSLTTTNASREGARAASVHGAGPQTDFLVLQTIKHGIAAQGTDDIEYVVIYRLESPDDPMPDICHTRSDDDEDCNRYVASDLDLAYYDTNGDKTDTFGCVANVSIDRYWCPITREDSMSGPPDLVGVYVKTRHTYMTGFIGESTTLEETTVIRIEPEADD